jgi:hypothetical protein
MYLLDGHQKIVSTCQSCAPGCTLGRGLLPLGPISLMNKIYLQSHSMKRPTQFFSDFTFFQTMNTAYSLPGVILLHKTLSQFS